MDRIMGDPPPPPPASVPAVEPDIRSAKTIRELLKRHTESASCAACHAKFDPVGLALENFDVIGGWLTEINVTSPTGIRAIKNLGGPDVAAMIWDVIESKRK